MNFLLKINKNSIDMKSSFIKAVEDIFFKYSETAIVLGDIGHFGFKKIWSDPNNQNRYYNLGILEQTMVGFSAGLSKGNFYPIIHTITPFLIERPYEQIKVDFGLNKLGGCFISVGGSFDYSNLGPTHHSYNDLALFSSIPGSNVFSVSSFNELQYSLQYSVENKSLSYIRMNRNIHNFDLSQNKEINLECYKLTEGNDVTIVVSGGRIKDTIEASEAFENQLNKSVEIIVVTKIKPLDMLLIDKSIFKTRKLLVVEDHGINGSLYSAIVSSSKCYTGYTHESINLSNNSISGYGTYEELAKKYELSIKNIFKKLIQITL